MDLLTKSIARELVGWHQGRRVPRFQEWATWVAQLRRTFKRRSPEGQVEETLAEMVRLADREGVASIGNERWKPRFALLAVAWEHESQKNAIGK